MSKRPEQSAPLDRRAGRRARVAVTAGLMLVGATILALPSDAQTKPSHAALADCGPGSVPEAGLQGFVPPTDPTYLVEGYRCNLELVGQFNPPGGGSLAGFVDAAYKDCLYVGNQVFDISDPARPVRTAVLTTPGISGSAEAGKVNVRRGLLAGGQAGARKAPHPVFFDGPVPIAFGGPYFDVYDLKQDCKHPTLLSSTKMYEDASPHSGGFSPDGTVYYSTGAGIGSMFAIDLSDPKKPKKLYEWTEDNVRSNGRAIAPHYVDFGPGDDGDIAFLPDMDNGLIVADLSEIRARKPGMQAKILSDTRWGDPKELGAGSFLGGYQAMTARVGRIDGRKYAFVTDEAGPRQTPAQACQEGLPPYGFVHVVDVTKPAAAKHVSTISMQVADPANCAQTAVEPGTRTNTDYSAHYCIPDNPQHTTALACSWTQAGIRVFDVRDPLNAREIAYYNPRPRLVEAPEKAAGAGKVAFTPNPLREATGSDIVWRTGKDGTKYLWFNSAYNGLQSLKFTNNAYPAAAPVPPAEPAAGAPTAAGAPSASNLQPGSASGAARQGGQSLPATGPRFGLALLAMLLLISGVAVSRRRGGLGANAEY
jgi:hypothetical protein